MSAILTSFTSIFVMSTSTTDNPAILNISSDPNESFKSVSTCVSLNDLHNVPVLHCHPAPTSLKKKLYISVLFLLLECCLSLLIYLSIKVDRMISLAGNYSLNVPAFGGFEGNFEVKEEQKLNLGLSGQLAAMKPKASSLWNQKYLDIGQS